MTYIYLSSFLSFYCLIFHSAGLYLTHCLSLLFSFFFSEKHTACLCRPFLCWLKSLEATALGDHVKKKTVFTVCVLVGESMHECLSLCALCTSLRVLKCVCVCAFIFSVVLPFQALGMFKASSCAVRICLSLFSKNTCSAFYQRAVLGRPGAVQG